MLRHFALERAAFLSNAQSLHPTETLDRDPKHQSVFDLVYQAAGFIWSENIARPSCSVAALSAAVPGLGSIASDAIALYFMCTKGNKITISKFN